VGYLNLRRGGYHERQTFKTDSNFCFHSFPCQFAQKTAIQVTKPAEIDVGNIKRLAVLDFRGPGYSGANVASVFTSKLFGTDFYTMIERAELKRIRKQNLAEPSEDM